MKRIIFLLLSFSVLFVVTSCNSSKPTSVANTINTATLTAEQQDIVDLLSMPGNQELLIFEFNTNEDFNHVEVWVEVYENGELVDRPAGLVTMSDSGETRNGRLAIIINQNDNVYQWTLSMVEKGGGVSHVGTATNAVSAELGRAFGAMNDPASIEDGKEIIIYSSTFQTANTPHHAFDTQTLQERPELLVDYSCAHLIKIIFTK